MMDELFVHETYIPYTYVSYEQVILPYKYMLIIYRNGDIVLYNVIHNINDSSDIISIIFQISDNMTLNDKNLVTADEIKKLYTSRW
jgi:hypothetical protein